ncbi:MAG: Ig-like domain-containing protein, partial [Candidatus Enterosoma sp.]|nr:Ig-like domain-containing protein [Candidatus Enterosoma sp.]
NFSQTVYATGTISKITTAFSSEHGNISFNISDGTSEFLVYRAVATSDTQFLVGDTVVVSGTLTNYKGTKEFAAKCVATTKARGTTTITVTGAENATVTGLSETAENGTPISFTVTANEGYVLSSVKAGDTPLVAGEDGSFTVTPLGGKLAITVETILVGSVSLDQETATVKIGETVTLAATVSGVEDTSVTWSSDHPEIASVADGVVTGVATGTATIIATSVADPTKSASCVVTVETAFEAKTFAKVTNTADIAVGDTVTLVCPLTTGAKVAGAFNSGNYYDGLDVTVSENSFQSLADMTTFSIEAGSSAGKFLLKDMLTGKYLYCKAKDSKIFQTNDASTATDWSITIDSTTGNVSITCTIGTTNREIEWNNKYTRFSSYKSGQTAIDLYELVA